MSKTSYPTQTKTTLRDPTPPQNRNWNLGFKTASSTYNRLRSGVGKKLTDRRITHYVRKGLYGEAARLRQEEADKQAKRPTRNQKMHRMVDDLVD